MGCGDGGVAGGAESASKPLGKWWVPLRVEQSRATSQERGVGAIPALEMLDETGPAAPVGCGYLPTKHRAPVTMATTQAQE